MEEKFGLEEQLPWAQSNIEKGFKGKFVEVYFVKFFGVHCRNYAWKQYTVQRNIEYTIQ